MRHRQHRTPFSLLIFHMGLLRSFQAKRRQVVERNHVGGAGDALYHFFLATPFVFVGTQEFA